MISGAAPLGGELVRQVRARMLKNSGGKKQCHVYQGMYRCICHFDLVSASLGYGLTETSPTCHIMPMEHANREEKSGSIGILLANLESRLVDTIVTADGKEIEEDVEAGKPGELWLRGPTIMKVGRPKTVLEVAFWLIVY
jgi:acyl-CoA synthetase (AMP-forming)/AMP-acid ligase II